MEMSKLLIIFLFCFLEFVNFVDFIFHFIFIDDMDDVALCILM